jgi:CHASE3 domain sensor protein
VKSRIVLAATCFACFLVTFIAGYKFAEDVAKIDDMRLVTSSSRILLISLLDAETGQRGYVITGDDHYLEPYHAGISAIQQKFADLKNLLISLGEQNRLGDIETAIEKKRLELEQTVQLRLKSFEAAAAEVDRHIGKNYMDDIRKQLDEIELWSDSQFAHYVGEALIAGRVTLIGLLLTLVLGVALAARTWP